MDEEFFEKSTYQLFSFQASLIMTRNNMPIPYFLDLCTHNFNKLKDKNGRHDINKMIKFIHIFLLIFYIFLLDAQCKMV